jgi:DNA end-binding protein Ku
MATKTKAAPKPKQEQKKPSIEEVGAIISGKATPDAAPVLEPKTASRATWSGILSVSGVVYVPIKSYKATDEDKVSFNMLHSVCKHRVNQILVCRDLDCVAEFAPKDAEGKSLVDYVEVPRSETVSGYAAGEKYVVLSDDEIEAQMSLSDKKLNIISAIKATDIDPMFLGEIEYLCAEKGFERSFNILRDGLVRRGEFLYGTRVERGHEYAVVLRPCVGHNGEHGMLLQYVRAYHEVRICEKWSSVADLTESEMQAADLLLEHISDEFHPEEHYDPYPVNLRKLINLKLQGSQIVKPEKEKAPAPTADLMTALKAALAAAPSNKAKRAAKGAKC